jgi:ATPase subunit of ABC transporter with duplicated ATPase domains
MALALVQASQKYGRLQQGFSFELESGYRVLAGPNNSGKSSILQLIFSQLLQLPDFGADGVVLVLPEREFAQPSTETGGRSLNNFNNELSSQNSLTASPIIYDNPRAPNQSELARLLLTHTDYLSQVDQLNRFLERLGFPRLVLRTAQLAHFDDVPIQFQGTGLRSLFTILCALTDPALRAILIDEPEYP